MPKKEKIADIMVSTILNSNGDPYGIRTHVVAVRGRSLNRLTKGPH